MAPSDDDGDLSGEGDVLDQFFYLLINHICHRMPAGFQRLLAVQGVQGYGRGHF